MTRAKQPKINDKKVERMAYLQPDPNPWLGVFEVCGYLLEGKPKDWKSKRVHYKGPFDLRQERIDRSGGAKVIHIRCSNGMDRIIITIERVGIPNIKIKT